MDGHAIAIITRAVDHGATVIFHDDILRIRGMTTLPTDIRLELIEHAHRIRRIVAADHCAACFNHTVITEPVTLIPWCRTHAQRSTRLEKD